MAKKDHSNQPKETGGVLVEAGSTPPSKARPATRNVSRSSTFVTLYANDVQIQTSPWDLRFVFGELTDQLEEGPGPSIRVNQTGELRVSPQFAKKLVQLIYVQLKAYEQTFGEIPNIPSLDS